MSETRSSRSAGRGHGRTTSRYLDPTSSFRLEDISSAIENANENLKGIDDLVQNYSQVTSLQSETIKRLKSDLRKSQSGTADFDDDRNVARPEARTFYYPHSTYQENCSSLPNYSYTCSQNYTRPLSYSERVEAPLGKLEMEDSLDRRGHEKEKWRTMNRFMEKVKEGNNDTRNDLKEVLDRRLGDMEKTLQDSKGLSLKASNNISDRLGLARARPNPTLFSFPRGEKDIGASAVLDNVSAELKKALKEEEERRVEDEESFFADIVTPRKTDEKGHSNWLKMKKDENKILRENLEGLKREMNQVKGGEGFFLTRIEELERQTEDYQREKEKASLMVESLKSRQDERLAVEKRNRILADNENCELRKENSRLMRQINDAKEEARDYKRSSKDFNEIDVKGLRDELSKKDALIKELSVKIREMQGSESNTKEETQEAIRSADEMRQSLTKLEEEKDSLCDEIRECRERILAQKDKYEEMTSKAHDAIRQWKLKVKKLEGENKSSEESFQELRTTNGDLVRELEKHKSDSIKNGERGEKLLGQVEELGEANSRLEEQLRIMEIQNEEMKSELLEKNSVVKDLRNGREVIEAEAIELRAKVKEGREERSSLVDKLKESNGELNRLQRNLESVENWRENRLENDDQKEKVIDELRTKIDELTRAKRRLEAENDELRTTSNQENKRSENKVANLETKLAEAKERESEILQESSNQRILTEAEMQRLTIELEEKSGTLKSNLVTIRTLEDNLTKLERDHEFLTQKNHDNQMNNIKMKERLEEHDQVMREYNSRLVGMNAKYDDLKETLHRKERELLELFRAIDSDLDELVILASRCSTLEFSSKALITVTPSTADGDSLFKALRPKVKWVCEAMANLGGELNDVKSSLVALNHENETLRQKVEDEKVKRHQQDADHDAQVNDIQSKFAQLSSFAETHAARDIRRLQSLSSSDPLTPTEVFQISPRSKGEIEKRYRNYKSSVDNLQRDLIEVTNATPRVVYAPTPPNVFRGPQLTSTPNGSSFRPLQKSP